MRGWSLSWWVNILGILGILGAVVLSMGACRTLPPASSPVTFASPTSLPHIPTSASTRVPPTTALAWTWDGASNQATPLELSFPNAQLTHAEQQGATHPDGVLVDLRGDGERLFATRSISGVVYVHAGLSSAAPIVWQNESPTWTITRMVMGDPNNDGRKELFLLLWQPDEQGIMRSHPFLMGWRGGYYRIIWGGSATPIPMQDVALADLDHDGFCELVVLEGGSQPGDASEYISVWHWQGWGFQQEWQSPIVGKNTTANTGSDKLILVDVNGDGQDDVVVIRNE